MAVCTGRRHYTLSITHTDAIRSDVLPDSLHVQTSTILPGYYASTDKLTAYTNMIFSRVGRDRIGPRRCVLSLNVRGERLKSMTHMSGIDADFCRARHTEMAPCFLVPVFETLYRSRTIRLSKSASRSLKVVFGDNF